MYRIDDNTFIDDMLVTCAEYQLFIDEMLNKEKYHQPDHWTTYQFPKGQAHQPILGVRHSDAEAFCTWLSERETRSCRYRLPTLEEARTSIIKSQQQITFGYWTNKTGPECFVWDESTISDSKIIDRPTVLFHARELVRNRIFDIDIDISRALDLAHIYPLDLDYDLAIAQSLDRAISRALEPNIARGLIHSLVRDLASVRNLTLKRDINRTITIVRTLIRTHILSLMTDHALDIYLDILILQSRITGHYPASEGIRLVKEHN
jgi:hypothetical protein